VKNVQLVTTHKDLLERAFPLVLGAIPDGLTSTAGVPHWP
jgi:hypothetical protein